MLRQHDAGWSNPRVLGILAVVFLCGIAFGSAVTNVFMHHRIPAISGNEGIDQASRVWLQRLQQELELTPAQLQVMTKELDDYAKYYQNIEDQREDVAEQGTQHILHILTPEQKVKFYKLLGIKPPGTAAPVSAVR
jgi:Spy/CpxP family protein refolding chaperone